MTPSEVDDLLGGRHTMVLATIGAGGMRVRVESVVSWDHRKLVAAG
jgi:hypothetical protein